MCKPALFGPLVAFAVASGLLSACSPVLSISKQDDELSPRPVKHLMQQQIIPASNILFAAAGDSPSSDRAWTELLDSIAVLGEGARQLQFIRTEKDQELWLTQAKVLERSARDAEAAVRARNPEQLGLASDAAYGACAACHEVFLPKPP